MYSDHNTVANSVGFYDININCRIQMCTETDATGDVSLVREWQYLNEGGQRIIFSHTESLLASNSAAETCEEVINYSEPYDGSY